MRKIPQNLLLTVTVILAVAVIGVYLWQHGRVNDLTQSNKYLTSQLSSLKSNNSKQTSDLTGQLNKANQTISQLSLTNNFVAGADCQTQQLVLNQEKSYGGAAGSTAELFSYENISKTPCVVNGYPGFLALDSTGHVMPNGPIQTGTVISNKGPRPITIQPSDKAYFALLWHFHDAVGTYNGCIQPTVIESTPPGNLLPLVIATSNLGYMCSGQYVGTPTISALGNQADFQ